MRSDHRRAGQARPAVLILEDDETAGNAAADAIDLAGYRPIWARDGRQGLEALKRERPGLMLIDLFMPGMSGSEFLRVVKMTPAWSGIPRVIMTGTNDPMIGVREDAAVLYKPLDLASLVHVVNRYCERPRRALSVPTAL